MFEFGVRITNVDSGFLGLVEGIPAILVHSASAVGAEADATRALIDRLERLRDSDSTRL